jgi:hypothetical protein
MKGKGRVVNRLFRSLVIVAALLGAARPAWAQSRPLVTEDPETVPIGSILLEAGVDFLQGAKYPVSGLTGNLVKLGAFGVSIGVSSIAEIQVDGAMANRLLIKSIDPTAPLFPAYTGDTYSTSSFEDVTVGAKIRLLAETETRPAIAIRFATRLPFVGTENGLGTETTDFIVGVAGAKTIESVRVVANVGLGILGDPERGDRQNHVMVFGLSGARALATGVEFVAELNGRMDTGSDSPPVGTDSRVAARVGGRLTRGPVRFDAGVIIGVTKRDPEWGATVGVTWVFKAFEVK